MNSDWIKEAFQYQSTLMNKKQVDIGLADEMIYIDKCTINYEEGNLLDWLKSSRSDSENIWG